MTGTLRISEAASLALHTMALLAAFPDRLLSAGSVAHTLGASEAHLAKVLGRLAHVGLVESVRGPRGGFRLARPTGKISLLEVYESIDGPLASGHCLLGRPVCGGRQCVLGKLLKTVNDRVRGYLTKTSLAKLARVYKV